MGLYRSRILSVAAVELRALRGSRGLRWACAGVAALVIASCALGWLRQSAEAERRDHLQDRAHQYFVAQPDRHPHRVAHYGAIAVRPASSLSLFDAGSDPWAGTTVFLEAHRRNTVAASEASQRRALAGFGALTPATVLQLALPILVIAIGFGAIARERDAGTWELLVGQGVSIRTVILGKLLAVGVAALVVSSPAFVALIVLALAQGDVAARAAGLVLGYGVFLATCATLTVLVSYLASSARVALVVLVMGWAVLWVVVPRVSVWLAERSAAGPTRLDLALDVDDTLRALGDSHAPDSPQFRALERELFARYGVSRREDLPVNFGGVVMREGEAATTAALNRHFDGVFDGWAAQDRRAAALAGFSPATSMRSLSAALAGTDRLHYVAFQDQAEAYRYRLVQWLNDMHIHDIAYVNDRAQRVDRERWATFPTFAFRPPSAGTVLWDARREVAGLLGWLLACFALLMLAPRWREGRP